VIGDTRTQTIQMGQQSWNTLAKSAGMARIEHADDMTEGQIIRELQEGGKLVQYQWTISLLIVTLRRPSGIRLVRSNESAVVSGLPFSLLTFFVGWWGLPWGPIYTIQSIFRNFQGGIDLTPHVVVSVGGTPRLSLFSV
jgi:hypothetical protein